MTPISLCNQRFATPSWSLKVLRYKAAEAPQEGYRGNNGKDNGNDYIIIGHILGLYWDSGKKMESIPNSTNSKP